MRLASVAAGRGVVDSGLTPLRQSGMVESVSAESP